MFTGVIKFPLQYFNQQVSTMPTDLGQWMKERQLKTITVYERGFVVTYQLVGNIAKAN